MKSATPSGTWARLNRSGGISVGFCTSPEDLEGLHGDVKVQVCCDGCWRGPDKVDWQRIVQSFQPSAQADSGPERVEGRGNGKAHASGSRRSPPTRRIPHKRDNGRHVSAGCR